jgi:hypothetical protein
MIRTPMNLFKGIAATALTGLAAFGFASASLANQSSNYAIDNNHAQLISAVESTGVDFLLNPQECNNIPAFGWYSGTKRQLVVCQENRNRSSAVPVKWTEEDLDTLRHEAQHLLQDCKDGRIDQRLIPIYRNPVALGIKTLGPDAMLAISERYASQGLYVVILEYEAFSVGALNNPSEQISDIKRICN